MNRRNIGKWMRMAAVVVMMLQMLIVPAAQAQQLGQDLQGSPTLQCHPVVTADCAGGQVTLSGDGSYHTVTIWLDYGTAGQRVLVDPTSVKAGTWTFDWSTLGVNVCTSHTLKATWSSTDSDGFGGSCCCSGKLLISHIECVEDQHKLEVHFVLNQSASWPNYAGSSVSFSMSTPYGTVNGNAAFSSRTSGDCHYYFYTNNVPDGTYAISSASLTVEGVTWNLWNSKSEDISGCQEYVPCSQTTDWQEYSRGAFYYSKGQWCQDVTYKKYDVHSGAVCDTKVEPDCDPYVDCQEGHVGPWTEFSRGPLYYKSATDEWCQDVTYKKYDVNSGAVCDTKTEPDCDPYVDCQAGNVGPWVEFSRGPSYYSNGQWCQDVTYKKYDVNSGAVCDTKTEPDCDPYEPCLEENQVLGGVISVRGPIFENGALCTYTTYALVDKYTGEQCDTTELRTCIPYQTCSATRRSRELSREGPSYVGGQICYKITYELVDAYSGEVCGQETVDECAPVGNGCNTPSINPSVTSQGHSVTVNFSAWGPGITGIQVYLLGDAQDGPHPGGGGAWYLLASSGPEGGSVTIDTSWLFPKNRTVWLKAIYPGGWWNCYGHFRVTPGPTPTLPVPGFVPCPTCVKPVVYQSNTAGQWEIYTANGDGSNELRLTDNAGADKAPHWHPSGMDITFQSNRDGNWEVYTMYADGSNQTNVSQNTAADVAPYWSCQYIYFMSDRDGNWEIYRMNRDGTQQTRLTTNAAVDAEPATSCNERVAFQSKRDGNWEIYTMNFDGTDVKRLTNTPWNETAPEWSPNGEWIVFQTDKTGQSEIAVMDVNGGNLRTIVRSASPDEAPAWHPYCEWIYFQTFRAGSWEIYRTNQDGTVTQRVGIRASSAEQLDDGSY